VPDLPGQGSAGSPPYPTQSDTHAALLAISPGSSAEALAACDFTPLISYLIVNKPKYKLYCFNFPVIRPGKWVTIHNQKTAHMNVRVGKVMRWDASGGAWLLNVFASECDTFFHAKILPANLRVTDTAGAAAASAVFDSHPASRWT